MTDKIKTAISGNDACASDLVLRIQQSRQLSLAWLDSMVTVAELPAGCRISSQPLASIIPELAEDQVGILFDLSSEGLTREAIEAMNRHGIRVIQLLATTGQLCIPPLKLSSLAQEQVMHLSLGSPAALSAVPLVAALSELQSLSYSESVTTSAARNHRPGTDLDAVISAAAEAQQSMGGAVRGKAICLLNPAEPPLPMRTTLHCLAATDIEESGINRTLNSMILQIQDYMPGYRLVNGPVISGSQISLFVELTATGGVLPEYAADLEILSASACIAAEALANGMSVPLPASSTTEVSL